MPINYDDYIDKLIEKDNDAFKVVYEHTKRGVFSIIISLVRNKTVTEDLMQDTYIKMIQKIRQYQKGRNFNAWLIQIAKNTALDYLRKSKKETLYDPQEQAYYHASQKTEGKTYHVSDLVESLNEDEKQIVLLRAVSEYKFKDIAKMVDKPLGTVLWIYSKAIKQLKKEVGSNE
ncbi:RNA polymerase sigma factor [Hujiaoplasma nucleasis]|uniref:RNA polymerase sigma factor n=1 Tax=Hujiaoplasma nucleasis TaxID=2725268 RepID=A0A7L6N3Q6_9MOLU|nr:RNA polymerase sigma factor [Hujiaoplasma nucleasis]QLY40880.1 RNA polymerase sigma factor [Hujiaoplasma nucleasis]